VDQDGRGGRTEDGDDEPYTEAAERAEDHGDEEKEFRVPVHVIEDSPVLLAIGFHLREDQEETASHCKVGHKDVECGDHRDKHAAAKVANSQTG